MQTNDYSFLSDMTTRFPELRSIRDFAHVPSDENPVDIIWQSKFDQKARTISPSSMGEEKKKSIDAVRKEVALTCVEFFKEILKKPDASFSPTQKENLRQLYNKTYEYLFQKISAQSILTENEYMDVFDRYFSVNDQPVIMQVDSDKKRKREETEKGKEKVSEKIPKIEGRPFQALSGKGMFSEEKKAMTLEEKIESDLGKLLNIIFTLPGNPAPLKSFYKHIEDDLKKVGTRQKKEQLEDKMASVKDSIEMREAQIKEVREKDSILEVNKNGVICQKGDGNCLLRSMAVGLYMLPEEKLKDTGKVLRSQIVESKTPQEMHPLIRQVATDYLKEHVLDPKSEKDEVLRGTILTSMNEQYEDAVRRYDEEIESSEAAISRLQNAQTEEEVLELSYCEQIATSLKNGREDALKKERIDDPKLREKFFMLDQTISALSSEKRHNLEEIQELETERDNCLIADYIQRSMQEGFFCDVPHIQALCEIAGVSAEVYILKNDVLEKDENRGYDNIDAKKEGFDEVIKLQYVNGDHYNFILFTTST